MPKTLNHRALTRREFSAESLTALFTGVAITITGCGGDDSPSPTSPGGSAGGSGDRSGAISANHGHVATVTSVQLNSGSSVTLNIQGTSDHPHTVTLTAAEVTQIRDGQRVSKTSSNDAAHTHSVTFN
jgi:hypothetical protein